MQWMRGFPVRLVLINTPIAPNLFIAKSVQGQEPAQAPHNALPSLQVLTQASIPSWQYLHPGTTASVAALQRAQSPHWPSQSKASWFPPNMFAHTSQRSLKHCTLKIENQT